MEASAESQTSFGDYLDLFRALDAREAQAVIVGGQAVNFWAEAFEGEEPELRAYRPFTSADLDLHRLTARAQDTLRVASKSVETQRHPFGKAFTIVSHTFLIQARTGRLLRVDHLKMVTGLRPAEVKRGTMTIEFGGVKIWILNPIACLKAKLHNLSVLDQQGRQDEKHVRILISCIRAFLRRLIREAGSDGNSRPALNGLQQLLLLTSRAKTRRTACDYKFDLAQSAPMPELVASAHPKIANFVSKRLPAWQQLMASASPSGQAV
jgi:hypothetical protein